MSSQLMRIVHQTGTETWQTHRDESEFPMFSKSCRVFVALREVYIY